MSSEILAVAGLSMDIIGAVLLACSLFFFGSRRTEYEQFYGSFHWWWPVVQANQEAAAEIATFADGIKTHRRALLGLSLLVVGYSLQIVAVLIK